MWLRVRPLSTAPASPYQVVTSQVAERLTGTIDFDGVIPADTIIELPADQWDAASASPTSRVERTGTRIGGAVVWITDIRQARRFQSIADSSCRTRTAC